MAQQPNTANNYGDFGSAKMEAKMIKEINRVVKNDITDFNFKPHAIVLDQAISDDEVKEVKAIINHATNKFVVKYHPTTATGDAKFVFNSKSHIFTTSFQHFHIPIATVIPILIH
ncbi:hypothetical protein AB7942_29805 [Neobacillus sp. BF23-41]|uniref:hypothetical protein n=1 Tax=Neobacillus sp. BF23-41 TaxID=3240280 RepID=UPI0034E4D339